MSSIAKILWFTVLVLSCGWGRAQYPPDLWMVNEYQAGYRVWAVGPASAGLTGMGAYAPSGSSVFTDAGECHVLYESSLNSVIRLNVDPITTLPTQQWMSQPIGNWGLSTYGEWSRMAVTRDRVWLLASDGRLGWFDRASGGALPTLVGNVRSLLGLFDPYDEPVSVCTNGRELFFSIGVRANISHHVFAVDLRSNPLTARPVTQLSLAPNMTVPRRGATLCMGPDGKILALDDSLLTIDPLSGNKQVISGPYWQGTIPQPLYPDKATPLAYNPWDGVAIAVPDRPRSIFHWSGTAWTAPLPPNGWLADLGPCHTTSPAPFLLFGKGCVNSANQEPRLGWQGVPRQGQSFSVTLRDAEPNGLAIIWLGWSDTFWAPVGALPFDAAPFGAPGCSLLVAPDAALPFWTGPNGSASFAVNLPVNPAIAGMQVFAQSVSSAGVNALGFVSSDAMVVRLR